MFKWAKTDKKIDYKLTLYSLLSTLYSLLSTLYSLLVPPFNNSKYMISYKVD